MNVAGDKDDSLLTEEIEVLESIYMDDIKIEDTCESAKSLKITVHPSTADDSNKKFVCLSLDFTISDKYPSDIPEISIKNPRGLSEAHLQSIEDNLVALAKSRLGESMLFELIEYAKDSLTDNNHPSCDCSICLEKFQENGEFFRTECYHYFHMYCIYNYVKAVDKLICPICRLSFTIEKVDLSQCKEPPACESVSFSPSKQYRQWLKESAILYEKQKLQGGIIDLEEEKNKFLITTNEPVYLAKSSTQDDAGDVNTSSSASAGDNGSNLFAGKENGSKQLKKQDYQQQPKGNKFKHNKNTSTRKDFRKYNHQRNRDSRPKRDSNVEGRSCQYLKEECKTVSSEEGSSETGNSPNRNKKHRQDIPKHGKERFKNKDINQVTARTNELKLNDRTSKMKSERSEDLPAKKIPPPPGFTTENLKTSARLSKIDIAPPPGFS